MDCRYPHYMRSDTSWLKPSWRKKRRLLMPSWGFHHVEPSWRHEGSLVWSPHAVMRAPHDGALMMAWEVSCHAVMRAPSCGALMTSWGLLMMEPPCHHEGSTWWSPHDIMRAPAMMHLNTSNIECSEKASLISLSGCCDFSLLSNKVSNYEKSRIAARLLTFPQNFHWVHLNSLTS